MSLAALLNNGGVITALISVDATYCPAEYVRVSDAAQEGMTVAQAVTAQQAIEVRVERDALLSKSDVYALADRITTAWTTYRQALRDVPEQAGFPTDVTWPTEPL